MSVQEPRKSTGASSRDRDKARKAARTSVSSRMTRFRFAFGEKIPAEVWREIEKLPAAAHRDLLAKALLESILPLHDERELSDEFVVYLDGDTPKHFGRIAGNKVRSEWGRGRVLNHGLWEVPLTYGNRVKYSSGKIDFSLLKKTIEGLRKRGKTSARAK
jgi:hypothetical protein